ncbi:hypothetical protein NL676_031606 [Syzygium grande]|nr:hypothetical protein NL676_031606 [Syzygium grande]
MEIGVLFFLVFFSLKVLSQDALAPLRIDCRSETSYNTGDGIPWHTDLDFVKTGQNVQLSNGNLSTERQISTLRYFPEQNKNCYSLPAVAQKRYFTRAVFCYGKYDGLSRPPSFGLEFDGNKWTTVSNPTAEPQYYKLVYTSGGDFISVCLARTLDKQYPYISALELWPLSDDMYATMGQDRAWTTSYRYNYGATESIMGYPLDKYNRKWQPMIPQGTKAVHASFASINRLTAEYPPDLAIFDAIEAPDPASSMKFSFDTNGSATFKYIVLYILETRFLNENETRAFDLYILGGTYITTISPQYQICRDFEVDTESIGLSDEDICIQLLPTINTTLPPIIGAIEIYASTRPLVTTRTSQDDCKARSFTAFRHF